MDISALASLLDQGRDSDDDASYGAVTPGSLFAPSSRAPAATSASAGASSSLVLSTARRTGGSAPPVPPAVASGPPRDPNAIWQPDEVVAKHELEEMHDARARPQHEIMYKQNLSAQDVYGGMSMGGGMGGSASAARELVVKVHFPGATAKQLDLDVNKRVFIAQSPFHKLKIHLPHEVDDASGRAQFDKETATLSVTLKIVKGAFDM
jgi:hypothetical protein